MLVAALVGELALYVCVAAIHDHDFFLGPEIVALHSEVWSALPALLAVAYYLVVAGEQGLAGIKHVQGYVDGAPQVAVDVVVRVADVHHDRARVVLDLVWVDVTDRHFGDGNV